jgi:glycosyltransferase involved in cell wall biosynthesis
LQVPLFILDIIGNLFEHRMKILYLAPGHSIHTQRHVEHLALNGHEVHLISRSPFEGNDLGGLTFHLLTVTKPQMRFISYPTDLFLEVVQIKKLIRKLNPDIIHAHWAIEYGPVAALSGFHPFVLSAWGGDIELWPKRSKIVRLMVKLALLRADVVLTTSHYLKQYLKKYFSLSESKIIALPWGVDLNIFSKGYTIEVGEFKVNLGIDARDFVILSPRHLLKHYRVASIVQAIPHITAKHHDVVLVVLKGIAAQRHLADNRFEVNIEQLIEQLGIEQNIRLIHRHLTPQEMAVVYNASDAFISLPKTDQFASSIQEGMACGTIPIVGDLEVYRQYLTDGENALFVDPNNPKDIADKVIYCIEHPELKQRFYAINRKIIEESEDWAKNAAKLEELYHSLLQGGSGF